jgi:hypothetical protein
MPKRDTRKVKKHSRKRYIEFAGIRVKDPTIEQMFPHIFEKNLKGREVNRSIF